MECLGGTLYGTVVLQQNVVIGTPWLCTPQLAEASGASPMIEATYGKEHTNISWAFRNRGPRRVAG